MNPPVWISDDGVMGIYQCQVCEYLYDEEKEGEIWDQLVDDWVCPVCGADKSLFQIVSGIST